MEPMVRNPSGGPRRLSFPQERLFLLDQIMPGQSAYNVASLYRIAATLDAGQLRQAFEIIVSRHEILRTAIRMIDGVPMAEVGPDRQVELTVADLRSTPPAEREPEAHRTLGELVRRPFDLSGDVLLRAGLVHVGPAEDLLLVVFHHIGSDHVSGELLLAELDEAYRAIAEQREPKLPELPIQYADYAEWQRRHLDAELLDELLPYWTDQLGGAPERLELPGDRPRPSAQSYRGASHDATIAAPTVAPLRELARREGVSLFMVLLAGFKTLLHRYTAVDDLVVGTPVSGRHYEEIAPLLGFFSNTLALRTDLSGDPTFAELLSRVRLTMLGALAHQELPFEKLVEVLNPERARSHSPVFQVLFGYDAVSSPQRTVAGAPAQKLPVPGWEVARFDLSIIVHDLPDGSLQIHTGYATDLFDAATIQRLVGHLETLLDAAGRDPERRLSRLPLLTDAERRLMLEEWNATTAPYDRRCLHEQFAQQAARRPDAIAVISASERISYGELDRRSNQLARTLLDGGAGPGRLVGICIERSVDLVIALLGVLKAGAAYVPIDPSYPSQRQEFMLADAEVPILLTEERMIGVVDPRGAQVLCVDRDREQIAAQAADALATPGDPEWLAYVIYTSGSTGQPKGVEVTHRSVANLLGAMRERPGLSEDDVVANITTPAFDLSVPDWYLPLTTGARLVIVPREATADGAGLEDWLARTGATLMQATPTTWQLLVDAGWAGSAGLKIVCGGEGLPPALAEQLQGRGAGLWHMYGPTETTVWSSIRELRPGDGPPPLGGPIANTSFYVLDANRQPAPIGIPGELYIGGDGVAQGYHQRPELSAEKFVASAFSPGKRLYRTGDLLRWRGDGSLEFHGRIDQQIKLRGYRIELGEIEAMLSTFPAVGAVAAAVRDIAPGDRRLIAYIVPGADELDPDELRRALKRKLPPFMVPSLFVTLPALPVTANGKLDRAALPLPTGAQPREGRSYAPPESPLEETLASIWSDVLAVDRVGIDDDFFELGGHSMLAVRMLARVQDDFGAAPYLGAMFDHSTIRKLSELLMLELLAQTSDDELAQLLTE